MEGSLGTHPRPKGRVPSGPPSPPNLPHPFPQELEEARRWEGVRDVRPLDGNVRRWGGLLLPVRGERARGAAGSPGERGVCGSSGHGGHAGLQGGWPPWGHGRD